jgi:hypothetical protein
VDYCKLHHIWAIDREAFEAYRSVQIDKSFPPMVAELADGIARRQALDAPLFRRTPTEASIVAQNMRVEDTLGLVCKELAARYGPTMPGRFIFS